MHFERDGENLAYLAPEVRLTSQYFVASDVYTLAIMRKALFEGKIPKSVDFTRLLQDHLLGDLALSPAVLSINELAQAQKCWITLDDFRVKHFEQLFLSVQSLLASMW